MRKVDTDHALTAEVEWHKRARALKVERELRIYRRAWREAKDFFDIAYGDGVWQATLREARAAEGKRR